MSKIASLPSFTFNIIGTLVDVGITAKNNVINIFPRYDSAETLEETLREQNKPILRALKADFKSEWMGGSPVDYVHVELANHGSGVAKNIFVRPYLVVTKETPEGKRVHVNVEDACFIDDAGGFEPEARYFPLSRSGTEVRHRSNDGGVLNPADGFVEFNGQVEFWLVHRREYDSWHKKERIDVHRLLDRLHSIGYVKGTFDVLVVYCDEHGNVDGELILGKRPELGGRMTVEDIEGEGYDHSPGPDTVHRGVERARDDDWPSD